MSVMIAGDFAEVLELIAQDLARHAREGGCPSCQAYGRGAAKQPKREACIAEKLSLAQHAASRVRQLSGGAL
jgi:hypothetical protein